MGGERGGVGGERGRVDGKRGGLTLDVLRDWLEMVPLLCREKEESLDKQLSFR